MAEKACEMFVLTMDQPSALHDFFLRLKKLVIVH